MREKYGLKRIIHYGISIMLQHSHNIK